MKTEHARCHCGNITAQVGLSKPLSEFEPRACDCDFCAKHGAAYITEAQGSLDIRIVDSDQAMSYQHGSGLADFLVCRKCGVLMAVTYTRDGATAGSLNSRTLENRSMLMPAQAASAAKFLSDAEKLERWKQVWFQNVQIN